MPLTSPEPDGARPLGARPRHPRRTRRRSAVALVTLTVASVASVGSFQAARAATPVGTIGSTASDCAPTGFARPAGAIPPGYIYSPTSFAGAIQDPQPDDTFAATSAGHPAFTGRLQTRVVNGIEEFLVCAHVGTNTPDDALTPFAVTAPTAHPATIVPQVQVIAPGGTTTSYTIDTPGLTGTAIAPYAGSTDPHEGLLQMWVPFSSALTDPGFTVRTEVRGTPALPGGGSTLVMGADEVFVHLGAAPVSRNAKVDQAVGLALDDSLIAERPTDPGPDDLNSVLRPLLNPVIKAAVEAQAPSTISDSWDWSPGLAFGTKASGTLNSLSFYGGLASLDVVDFNAQESRLQLHLTGTMYPKLTLRPRAAGFVSILSGSCDVTATVNVDLQIGVTLDLDATGSRPTAKVSVLTASGTTTNVNAEGTLLALYTVLPGPLGCNTIEDDISSGLAAKMKERLQGLAGNAAIQDQIADKVNTSSGMDLVDLTNGPIANAQIPLPAGGGFGIANASYVQTAPANHLGGKIWIWHEGIDVAASLAVTDRGGSRFPSSYRPGASASVVSSIHNRTRPGTNTLGTIGPINVGVLETSPATPTTTMPPVMAPLDKLPTLGVVAGGATPTTAPPVPPKATLDPTMPSRTTVAPAPIVPAKGTATPTTSVSRTATQAGVTAAVPVVPVAAVPTATAPPATAPAVTPIITRGIDPSVLAGTAFDLVPTDFDLGMVVNGASVNQLSRALTAGAGEGSGILDLDVPVGGNQLQVRPSVPPMYLPNAPVGWSVSGPVRLYVPSARLSMPGTPFTVAADAMIGADFTIDATTNHLVPRPSSAIALRLRFLRLAPGTNLSLDPGAQGFAFSAQQVADLIGPKTLDIMRGLEIPDLKSIIGQSMVLSSLTLATTGGGHLGIFLNVDPNPARVGVGVSWAGAANAKPTGLSATATPQNFPGSGSYSVIWTVRDGNLVKYRSAAPEGLTKSWNTSILPGHRDGNCSDEAYFSVTVTAQISRGNITQSGSGTSVSPSWTVPVNTHICGGTDTP